MTTTQSMSEPLIGTASAATVDLKLEVVVIPVSDVERAKRFYQDLRWRLDADFAFDGGFRVVQLFLADPRPAGEDAEACGTEFGDSPVCQLQRQPGPLSHGG